MGITMSSPTTPVPPLISSDSKHTAIQSSKTDMQKSVVTQETSTTTAVTVHASAGVITCFTSTLAADATEVFAVNNSNVSSTSVVLANVVGYTGSAATGVISVYVTGISEGTFNLVVGNGSAAALDGVLSIGFVVL